MKTKKQTKHKQPLISVLMPVHNAALYLTEAIKSMQAQTYKRFELLTVDDGSDDQSLKLLKAFQKRDRRIKILTNTHKRGISYSLNLALKNARGEFIARMDADDISLSTRLQVQLEYLQRHKDVIACGGQVEIIDYQGRRIAFKKFPTDHKNLYTMIMRVVPIQHPVLMARADVMKAYRYRETLSTAEDVDMLFYLLSVGKIANVTETIYKYRKSAVSNGYHNVKKTFKITFKTRLEAIVKYGYLPTPSGILTTFVQFFVVSLLPSRLVVIVFEALRFQPPVWKRSYHLNLNFVKSAITYFL